MIINVVGAASMVNVIDGYGSVPVPGEYDFFVNNIEQIKPWLLNTKIICHAILPPFPE